MAQGIDIGAEIYIENQTRFLQPYSMQNDHTWESFLIVSRGFREGCSAGQPPLKAVAIDWQTDGLMVP
jgi:hypothetical protein